MPGKARMFSPALRPTSHATLRPRRCRLLLRPSRYMWRRNASPRLVEHHDSRRPSGDQQCRGRSVHSRPSTNSFSTPRPEITDAQTAPFADDSNGESASQSLTQGPQRGPGRRCVRSQHARQALTIQRASVTAFLTSFLASSVATHHTKPEPHQCPKHRRHDGVQPQRPREAEP